MPNERPPVLDVTYRVDAKGVTHAYAKGCEPEAMSEAEAKAQAVEASFTMSDEERKAFAEWYRAKESQGKKL